MSELSKALSKSSAVQPMTSRITSSGGEQAMRVDARSPPDSSGSPRFQGRLREPAASSTDACQSSSRDWDQAKCRDRLLPIDSMQAKCAGADDEVAMSESGQDIFHGCHPNFLNSGFTCAIAESISSAVGSMPRNAINSLITVSGSSVSLAKLIRWTGTSGCS